MTISKSLQSKLDTIEFPKARKAKKPDSIKYIVITGNTLSCGKTSALQALESNFVQMSKMCLYERWQDNVFLKNSRKRFQSELYFLTQDIIDNNRISNPIDSMVIQEVPAETDYLYASTDFVLGDLSKEEYALYKHVYSSVSDYFVKPDLVINLDCDITESLNRIKKRAQKEQSRIFELKQTRRIKALDYLSKRFIKKRGFGDIPILTIDSKKINFVDDEVGKKRLAELVRDTLKLPII